MVQPLTPRRPDFGPESLPSASDGPPRPIDRPPLPLPEGLGQGGPVLRAAAAAVARARSENAATQAALDSFRAAMTPTYHTPEGDVVVPTPFGMRRQANPASPPPAGRTSQTPLDALAARAGVTDSELGNLRGARGAPDIIQRVTQALIDTHSIPSDSGEPLATRIRRLMSAFGIGIDCAGYTQQAYLRASHLRRAEVGFDSIVANETLSTLPQHGFTRVAAVRDLRPGDIAVLGPPSTSEPGHRAIVYDQHEATASELQDLLAQGDDAQRFASRGTIRVVLVDSSWGSGGNAAFGGVDRRTWWFNESSGEWAWRWDTEGAPPGGRLFSDPGPYSHPLVGFFRGPDHGSTRSR